MNQKKLSIFKPILKSALICSLLISVFANSQLAVIAQENSSQKNIVQVVKDDDSLSILESIIQSANLEDSLSITDNITLLAPTNEALAKLPTETRENLLKPENRDKLLRVLRYHVILKDIKTDDIKSEKSFVTLLGTDSTIAIKQNNDKIVINNKELAQSIDENPKNGSIIKVNEIILPANFDVNSLNAKVEDTPRTGGYSVGFTTLFALIILLSSVYFGVYQLQGKKFKKTWN
jgi:uncharacterized surface protein with fasciclin (FAS1) repeats